MSKVITFSRVFQKTHPKVGQPTYFVEKILQAIYLKNASNFDEKEFNKLNEIGINPFDHYGIYEPKFHTIRGGHRWKVGDKFSPRVWSGKPYRSYQIIIASDIEIKKIWDFKVDIKGLFYLNGKNIDVTSTDIPINDGLDSDDFLNWFPVGKEFSGQILCWRDDIYY